VSESLFAKISPAGTKVFDDIGSNLEIRATFSLDLKHALTVSDAAHWISGRHLRKNTETFSEKILHIASNGFFTGTPALITAESII